MFGRRYTTSTGTVLWDSRSRQIPEVQIRAQIPVESYTSLSDTQYGMVSIVMHRIVSSD